VPVINIVTQVNLTPDQIDELMHLSKYKYSKAQHEQLLMDATFIELVGLVISKEISAVDRDESEIDPDMQKRIDSICSLYGIKER